MTKTLLILSLWGSFSMLAQAEDENILNFEAEVIEGEKTSPDLFLQMGVDSPDLATVLYKRNSFTDFHNQEKKRRPRYIQFKNRRRQRRKL